MIGEIIIICVIGTLLHFTYEFSKHNKVVGLFAAVNESTWEHIKIALTPTFILSVVDGVALGMNPNYIFAKFICFTTIIVLIPILFYSYTAFTKKAILPIDVICFYITIAVSQILFFKLINYDFGFYNNYIAMIGIFIEFALYMVLTLAPMKNFIFKDPITNKYGLEGHSHEHEHDHKHEEEK